MKTFISVNHWGPKHSTWIKIRRKKNKSTNLFMSRMKFP